MSGHSHYATIKRQKEAKDSAKGRIFSRHAKAIALAIKAGGSADPELNSKLRFAIDQAKADNMPKANIDRILQRSQEMGDLEEVMYEGYGPLGVGVVVDVVTNNRNRTSQEIKNIFERAGGRLAGPGSVSYNFELKGMFTIKKDSDADSQMLKLIDLGVEDIFEAEDGLEIYVSPDNFQETRDKLTNNNFEILSSGLVRKPKNYLLIENESDAKKVMSFLDALEDHDDVQGVYSNFDFSPASTNTQ
jgi:YebC/PmpR family DNA-binding regulatory protein